MSFSTIGKSTIVTFCAAVLASTLWLGVQSIIITVQGDKNPSLPLSTTCAVLGNSMMPYTFLMTLSRDWHLRASVNVLTPSSALNVVVENRCFNGGMGSSFLWVNDQLAAFSRVNGDIFDCHGNLLWKACYACSIDGKPKLKVYSGSDNAYIWASDIPKFEYYGTQLVYGQPEDLVCATILYSSSGSDNGYTFTISNALSPACDPRLLIMLYARAYFSQYMPASKRKQFVANDGCNAFVYAGGIFISVYIIIFICGAVLAFQKYQDRKQQITISNASHFVSSIHPEAHAVAISALSITNVAESLAAAENLIESSQELHTHIEMQPSAAVPIRDQPSNAAAHHYDECRCHIFLIVAYVSNNLQLSC